ncbi:hypothetical protein PPERSA_08904 [Pseudocohnilembus persalinus]|uniref:Uncharacterized protein n=1 Tax=Pseudocohnilembus persalinus TaxID=266149 RepID=A0A0V0R394_PSEPJ|nr:hypothetical protein PPERSA_08904 [Pseudocohnilembus persalinus]|eukprot:KRX08800.1 hypothetical protein PPERSA_08904 [Pseudocohnilembus persalinus]
MLMQGAQHIFKNYFSIDVDSSSNPADAVQIKGNYLYIGEGWGGIKIYDISDIDNPVNWSYDGYIYLSGDSDSIEITNDEQYMIVANGGTGISLVNIADKTNPFQIGQWNNDKPKGSAENVLLNSMENLVFGSIRNYGLVILDISDKSQAPVEIGEYYTGMCEFVTLSSNEKQQIGGFPTKMKMIQYGELEYLLVNTRDKELLNAINITDVYNPSLFGKYDPGYEQAFDLAYTEDQKYLYMLTDEGLRVLQVKIYD